MGYIEVGDLGNIEEIEAVFNKYPIEAVLILLLYRVGESLRSENII